MAITSAAHKVFSIYELLEMIVCEIPSHDTHNLRCVSRFWKNVIGGSKAMRETRLLRPRDRGEEWEADELEYFNQVHQDDSSEAYEMLCRSLYWCSELSYPSSAWPRLNPKLQILSKVSRTTHVSRWGYIFLPDSLDQHIEIMDQLVADPPVCALSLKVSRLEKNPREFASPRSPHKEHNAASAYNRDGLRIRDLIATKTALIAAQERYIDASHRSNLAIMALFEVESFLSLEDLSASDKARIRQKPNDYGADLAYFKGPLPRHRRLHHSLETELKAAKMIDKSLELKEEDFLRQLRILQLS